VVSPEGRLVEQLSGDPLQRALEEARSKEHSETLLWDLTDSIRAAAKDKRIPVLVLDLEHFEGGGQPTLEELARAIREFRASGKKVIAFATNYLQAPYYIAAQADEIYVDPLGSYSSTAMTAIGCTSRMRSTSSTSTSTCSASALSKARWRSIPVTTCPRMPTERARLPECAVDELPGRHHHGAQASGRCGRKLCRGSVEDGSCSGGDAPAVALKAAS